MSNLGSTQPTSVSSPKGPRGGFWLGLLGLIVFLALGLFGGYQFGMKDRVDAANTQMASTLTEQFVLAQQDLDAGRYDFARQRLEYIISKDPNFPGAGEKLTEVLFKMSITPSPTVTPSPTLTPTPDLRNAEAIFTQVRSLMDAGDWDSALASLDALRKSEPGYNIAQVDGMYYIALRQRGVNKILGTGAYAGRSNLEGGIYDLTLAERFGALDTIAGGYRTYARLYLTAAAYWELDWKTASELYAQVYAGLPFLTDGTLTAAERYREAAFRYGMELYRAEQWCDAEAQLEIANSIRPEAALERQVLEAQLKCSPPTATPSPTIPGTTTPDVGGTETPTATP